LASHEIAPLNCPSCGSSTTGPTRPLAFGAEFTCAHCGSTSVLIINRALMLADALQATGDQVCAICGRVARREARFCQDGHKLVRECLKCHHEFAAHHHRCDDCGWPQSTIPGTSEADAIELERAIQDLGDRSAHVVCTALATIRSTGRRASRAVPAIIDLLTDTARFNSRNQNPNRPVDQHAWYTLASMGEVAAGAAPILQQLLRERPDGHWAAWSNGTGYCLILAAIAPKAALPLCRAQIGATGRDLSGSVDLSSVLNVARVIGSDAVPMLWEYCGMFSGERGRQCHLAADLISNEGKMNFDWDRELVED
jgi:hypothetical protein